MSEPILNIQNLSKDFASKYGTVQAVNDVSFSVMPGETLGIVGESGCGKSTLGRCVVRGIDPTRGRVLYRGGTGEETDLTKLKGNALRACRKDLQMIFQDPYSSLDPRMTVFDIISEPLRAGFRLSRKEITERVGRMAELTGLDISYLRRYPHAFSGGQRQRIGIARALITHPRIIVCDEAVSALDVSIQAQILNLLKSLQQELGLTYLFISHALSAVQYISDRVMVMYLGKTVEIGIIGRLFSRPFHPYTEALLSAIPVPDPRVKNSRIVLKGEVPGPTAPPSGCCFHTRCRYAEAICSEQVPALRELEPGHCVACHRAENLNLWGINT